MHSQPRLDVRSPETEILARQGLRLPGVVLNRLRSAGIYSQPTVSIERQHVARRYVLRGVESGGAIRDLGAYTSFVDEHGELLPWLQRVDSIEVNGVHAIAVAPVLIRLEMVRIERTYDLLITRHSLTEVANGTKPRLESSILSYGRRGCLEMELWGKDAAKMCDSTGLESVLPPTFCGIALPMFSIRRIWLAHIARIDIAS